MNYIDNIVVCDKFYNSLKKRHVSKLHVISTFINLDPKYIQVKSKSIINTRYLNMKNINTIIKCIKIHIKVTPIIFLMSDKSMSKLCKHYLKNGQIPPDDIIPSFELLYTHVKIKTLDDCIQYSFMHGNLNTIKFLIKRFELSFMDFGRHKGIKHPIIIACKRGHVGIIKYFSNYIKFHIKKFIHNSSVHEYLQYLPGEACTNNNVILIKYLHRNIGLNDFHFYIFKYELNEHNKIVDSNGFISSDRCSDNRSYKNACYYGCIDVVKYLHKSFELDIDHFRARMNFSCVFACVNGHIKVVEYLHKNIGLCKEDFRDRNNYACIFACVNCHIEVVKYLHKEVGFCKEDFQDRDNYACTSACAKGYIDIVKYLHKEVGLSKEDFQSRNNYACAFACANGHIEVVKYLHKEVGLCKEDFKAIHMYNISTTFFDGNCKITEYLSQELNLFIYN